MIVEEIEKNLILYSIWIGKNSAPNCSVYHSYKVCSDDIEYVRKDVARKEVIEKACEWLDENLLNYWSQDYTGNSNFIEDLKKALEED